MEEIKWLTGYKIRYGTRCYYSDLRIRGKLIGTAGAYGDYTGTNPSTFTVIEGYQWENTLTKESGTGCKTLREAKAQLLASALKISKREGA